MQQHCGSIRLMKHVPVILCFLICIASNVTGNNRLQNQLTSPHQLKKSSIVETSNGHSAPQLKLRNKRVSGVAWWPKWPKPTEEKVKAVPLTWREFQKIKEREVALGFTHGQLIDILKKKF